MLRDFLHLFFPRYCLACRGPVSRNHQLLCMGCSVDLPRTQYHRELENEVWRRFMGLLPLEHAFGYLHFAKGGAVQKLLHQLKYEGRPEVGTVLGQWYGTELRNYGLADAFDIILPIPLHPSKQRRRGYNQSDALAAGLALGMQLPWAAQVLARTRATRTQTRMSRAERYANMQAVFAVANTKAVAGKRVLLVDDVITTGATLQACGETLLRAGAAQLSIAALAVAQ